MDHIGRIRSAGGNRDGLAIAAVGSIARDQRARNERTILVVLSDGAPCESEAFVADCVAGARKAGTAVLSVAVEQGLTEIQDAMYGRESVVVWHGDWNRLATDLADSLGRVA
jgi:nitric oxide reductase activation protein